MTTRQMKRKSKNIIWTIIILAPILLWILSYYSGNTVTITDVITQTGIENSTITNAMNEIFATGGYLELVAVDSFFIQYSSYIITVILFRIFVNVISFIPLVVGNLLSKWSRADEENLL